MHNTSVAGFLFLADPERPEVPGQGQGGPRRTTRRGPVAVQGSRKSGSRQITERPRCRSRAHPRAGRLHLQPLRAACGAAHRRRQPRLPAGHPRDVHGLCRLGCRHSARGLDPHDGSRADRPTGELTPGAGVGGDRWRRIQKECWIPTRGGRPRRSERRSSRPHLSSRWSGR